ncbi:MAG TPA: hypothetical protein VN345_07345 [Blastocatellia bacterium]|nr:hypothetical protein [Blastocatellia bacterium]
MNSFQLATLDLGLRAAELSDGLPQRDSCAPTAACARCHSLGVRSIDGEETGSKKVVCIDCRALLELSFE